MVIKINDLEYRLLNDYSITEQAGSTAVMEVGLKLDSKREPQPFDTVEILESAKDYGGDVLLNGGIKENIEVIDGTLKLKKQDSTPLTVFSNLTLGDLT